MTTSTSTTGSTPLGNMAQLLSPSRQQRRLASLPQDRDQRLVTTPYGRGLVLRTHPQTGMQDIQMLDWDTASPATSTGQHQQQQQQQPTMLHSSLLFKSVTPMVGDDVLTVYGRGRVIGLKPQTHTVIVELTSWRLAQRSTVKCYLDVHQVQVVRTRALHEMDAWERVQHAQELKRQASDYFGNKDYQRALECYSRAVDAVRNVQYDVRSSNEVRADLVTVMVTCCNNAATCCSHLAKHELASNFAKNALVMIDALYEKRGLNIHSILVREGLSDAKLFGEYKVKALLMIARGLAERGEYASAIDSLKQANEAIAMYAGEEGSESSSSSSRSHLLSQQKQVKRLHATCVQGKKALKAKERQRAQAMFASPSKDTEKDKRKDANPIVTPSPDAASKETETDEELEELSEQGSETTSRRSVSFADDTKPGSGEFLVEQEKDDEEEETPWYEEHKEALVLSAVAGLTALSVVLLRFHRK